MKKNSFRTLVSTPGQFIATPKAFGTASEGVKNFAKIQFVSDSVGKPGKSLTVESGFLTDRLLLDFKALDTSGIDPKIIANDCDFLKKIVKKHPEILREMAEALSSSPDGFKKASKISQKIGLTETAAIASGGGLLWLLAAAALVIMVGSCEHCHASHKPHNPPDK